MQTVTLQPNKSNPWATKKPSELSVKKTPSAFEAKEGASSSTFNTQTVQDVNRDIYDSWQNFLTTSSISTSSSESNMPSIQTQTIIGGLREISFQQTPTFDNTVTQDETLNFSILPNEEADVKEELLKITKEGVKDGYKQTKDLGIEAKKLFLFTFFGIDKGEFSKESINNKEKPKNEKRKFNPFANLARFAKNILSLENMFGLKMQRENVNAKLRLSNLSYEGFISDNGHVRVDVLSALDRANSELQEAELKKKRQMQVAKANKRANLSLNLNAQEGNSKVANQIATAG